MEPSSSGRPGADRGTPPERTGAGDWRRRTIVRFIRDFGRRQGHPPTLREIADGTGLAVSTVSYHVSVLERDGTLRHDPGRPRTIVEPADPAPRPGADEVEVPLLGQIPAGIPLDAVELPEDTFRLPRRLVGHGTLFMLTVKGDSMTGAAIADGDLVVVRQQPVAENGEIIAAQFSGDSTAEATVKTLQRINGHAWLIPHNPAYQPIPRRRRHHLGQGCRRRPPGPAHREPAAALSPKTKAHRQPKTPRFVRRGRDERSGGYGSLLAARL